jgi:three-Cys-motif partner protein
VKKNASGKLDPVNQRTDDPYPTLPIERGPENTGVGRWVPAEKHRLLFHYLYATRDAWKKWPNRIFIDPFAGPGRIQVAGEPFTRDGGAVIAWRALAQSTPFTRMLVGDIDPERAYACGKRLEAAGASVLSYAGPATETVKGMVQAVPLKSLCMAYVDPYNLELLTFSIIQELAKLRKVDLAINFSTMDLQRNADAELKRARFDATAPGWREDPGILGASRQNIALEFFRYWHRLVLGLGFEHSKEMPLVCNDQGSPIYRIVFFARHRLPNRIWGDVARGRNRSLELFPGE